MGMRKKRDTDDGRCELKDDKGTLSKPDGATFPVDGQCSKCENGVIIKTEDSLCSPRKRNRKRGNRSNTEKKRGRKIKRNKKKKGRKEVKKRGKKARSGRKQKRNNNKN